MNYNRSNSSNNNFARTCSRLSQFLKERRRSLGDQSCFAFPPISPAPSPISDPRKVEEEMGKKVTMSLFPKNMEKEDKASASEVPGEILNSLNLFPLTTPSAKEEAPKITTNMRELAGATEEAKTPIPTASMTIFYGGKVLVFDEVPEDKAQEVISLASQGIRKSTNAQTHIQTQTQPQNLASPSNNNLMPIQDRQDTISQLAGGPSDLPIARRTSLFRFIEKRKDRVASAAPYEVPNNTSTGMVNSNRQRYNAVMRNLCQRHQEELTEEQKQKQSLELKL